MSAHPEPYEKAFAIALRRRTAIHEANIARIEHDLDAAERGGYLSAYLKDAPSVMEQLLEILYTDR